MSIHTGKYVPYLRVSTDAQGADGYGIEAQREAINRHLNGGDWELLEEFVEVESGKKTMRRRPVLNKAIAYALEHDATVIVAKIDRMTRSMRVLQDILDSNCKIIFCDIPNMGNPSTNRLILNVMASIAQFEGDRISSVRRTGWPLRRQGCGARIAEPTSRGRRRESEAHDGSRRARARGRSQDQEGAQGGRNKLPRDRRGAR